MRGMNQPEDTAENGVVTDIKLLSVTEIKEQQRLEIINRDITMLSAYVAQGCERRRQDIATLKNWLKDTAIAARAHNTDSLAQLRKVYTDSLQNLEKEQLDDERLLSRNVKERDSLAEDAKTRQRFWRLQGKSIFCKA